MHLNKFQKKHWIYIHRKLHIGRIAEIEGQLFLFRYIIHHTQISLLLSHHQKRHRCVNNHQMVPVPENIHDRFVY